MSQPLPETQAKALLDQAEQAMVHAIATWSDFPVGAALRCDDGTVITGCNVESPTLLQEICAERVALYKALSEGHRRFSHVAIVTPKQPGKLPCGLCRQLLIEFAPDLIVVTADAEGNIKQVPLLELLPDAFLKP